jgi:hypothetical protein
MIGTIGDLHLELALETVRTRGRASAPPTAELVRELSPADLGVLLVEKGSTTPSIVKLRESHHALARALAQGMKPGEAAALVGYSLSRVSIIQQDPAFINLLAVYRKEVEEIFHDFNAKLKTIAVDAADILHERMLDDPDSIKDGTLIEIMKAGADRSGHGPQSKSTNINLNVDLAGRLEAARRRAGLAPQLSLPPAAEGPAS